MNNNEYEEKRQKEEFLLWWKKFKKNMMIFFGFSLVLFWLLNFNMIRPGYVGIVVDLFGDEKGVEPKELTVGAYWIAPWKKVYTFPIFEQNDTWENDESFNFQTSEGLACSADIGITYHLYSDHIHTLFAKYRRGMAEISHVFIKNYIRDAINTSASKMKIEDLYGQGKEQFLHMVEDHVRKDLKHIGIEISRIYLIGRFHFPDNVIRALNSKIEATQRAQQRENELRESEAEAKKLIAKAEGEAKCLQIQAQSKSEANNILSKSITTELLMKEFIDKWNGQLPMCVGGATPIIDTRIPNQKTINKIKERLDGTNTKLPKDSESIRESEPQGNGSD